MSARDRGSEALAHGVSITATGSFTITSAATSTWSFPTTSAATITETITSTHVLVDSRALPTHLAGRAPQEREAA
jgi:hypothetical protein